MKTLPKIAKNKSEFDNALFAGPTTFDGYIVRQLKNGIKFWYKNEIYLLNKFGVFCHESRVNGKPWYQIGGNLNRNYSNQELAILAEQIR